MSALVRITTGIMPQHSRVGMTRAMSQFGEVQHCHKPPYSGIPGEDFVNVRFATQDAADRAKQALKTGSVFVDGFPVGIGAVEVPKESIAMLVQGGTTDFMSRRTPSPARQYGRSSYRTNRSPRRRSPKRNTYVGDSRGYAAGGGGGGGRRPRSRSRSAQRRDTKGSQAHSREEQRVERYNTMLMNGGLQGQNSANNQPALHQRGGTHASSGAMAALTMQPAGAGFEGPGGLVRTKKGRTPSPDPPGPTRNLTLTKNPFYRPRARSPTPDSPTRGYDSLRNSHQPKLVAQAA